MIWEILLCAAAAALILGALWLLAAKLLLPLRTKRAAMVLLGRGEGDTLELDCRAYLLLKSAGALQCPLYLVDAGLSDPGRALASQLARLDADITLCPADRLAAALAEHEFDIE